MRGGNKPRTWLSEQRARLEQKALSQELRLLAEGRPNARRVARMMYGLEANADTEETAPAIQAALAAAPALSPAEHAALIAQHSGFAPILESATPEETARELVRDAERRKAATATHAARCVSRRGLPPERVNREFISGKRGG